nr:MAG TPA: hypothetical protein [Bacteriophage sp.]
MQGRSPCGGGVEIVALQLYRIYIYMRVFHRLYIRVFHRLNMSKLLIFVGG